MSKKLILIYLLCIVYTGAITQKNNNLLFDQGWRFYLGGAQGAESIKFNDSAWRKINLPHDWSIEDRPGTRSPFSPTAVSQVSGGFTTGGTAWYRKAFIVPASDITKHLIIQFDGVYMNADIWINGKHLGNHPYGYTSFFYDITKYVHFGEVNIIAVEVKNEGQNSRWFSGSGIYRHVWLRTVNAVDIAQWGTTITTSEVKSDAAKVAVQTVVLNQIEKAVSVKIINKFLDNSGTIVAKAETEHLITSGGSYNFRTETNIKNPALWSCEVPALYRLVTEIYSDGVPSGIAEEKFGIRSILFDVSNGFQLNGKMIKLKGGCFHNDNGPLGSKAYNRAEVRKVELLKFSGFNAIRCTHNPPSPAFLAACDSLGMLVINEAFDMWNYGKNPYDYHLYFKDWWKRDIESMVNRDKNQPCIMMWSIGNEIQEKATAEGVATAEMLRDYVHKIDATRPVTAAVNDLNEDKDLFFAALDIAGYNYAAGGSHLKEDKYLDDHGRVPSRIMFGSESYPLEAFQSWMAVLDHPYVIGDFVWTAFDYMGESSLGWLGYPQKANFYPWNLAFCGDLDICGWKRPQSFYRDALWKENALALFVKNPQPAYPSNPDVESWSKWNWDDVSASWNWQGMEGKPLNVDVYSSCAEVELFLNNKSLGRKPTSRSTKFIASWSVTYATGELKAIGYNQGKAVNTSILRTAARPVTINLSADRTTIHADNQDLSYVTVSLMDADGNINPDAASLVKFNVKGAGIIAGVGNANPVSIESNQLPERYAWKGRCLVILKASDQKGDIILEASVAGLKTSQLIINVE